MARRQFHVYVDETGSFATTAFGEMLSQARNFGVGIVLAFQYLRQLDNRLRDAVLANVGTLVCFRLGATDGQTIGAEFEQVITAHDLMRLGAPDRTPVVGGRGDERAVHGGDAGAAHGLASLHILYRGRSEPTSTKAAW